LTNKGTARSELQSQPLQAEMFSSFSLYLFNYHGSVAHGHVCFVIDHCCQALLAALIH